MGLATGHPLPFEDCERRLTALYDETSSRVYGFVIARCGDPVASADVLSETYVAAARAMKGDNPDQVSLSWLLTTARRRLIDHWRRQETQRRTVVALTRLRPPAEPVPIDGERVRQTLARLSDRHRLALTLRYLDGYSVGDIAEAMRISYSATESTLARARRAFQRAWEQTE